MYIWGGFGFVPKEKSSCSVFIIRFSDTHITNTGEEKGVWGVYHIFAVHHLNPFSSSILTYPFNLIHSHPSDPSNPSTNIRHLLSQAKSALYLRQFATLAESPIHSGRLLWMRKTFALGIPAPCGMGCNQRCGGGGGGRRDFRRIRELSRLASGPPSDDGHMLSLVGGGDQMETKSGRRL